MALQCPTAHLRRRSDNFTAVAGKHSYGGCMHASVGQGHDAPGEQPDSILRGAFGPREHAAALERLPGDGRHQCNAVAQHRRPFGEGPQPRCAIEPQGRGK